MYAPIIYTIMILHYYAILCIKNMTLYAYKHAFTYTGILLDEPGGQREIVWDTDGINACLHTI